MHVLFNVAGANEPRSSHVSLTRPSTGASTSVPSAEKRLNQSCRLSVGPEASGALRPIASVDHAVVFSELGDALVGALDLSDSVDGQVLTLPFDSPSASINSQDGPLAGIYVWLSSELGPGEEVRLILDLVGDLQQVSDNLLFWLPYEGSRVLVFWSSGHA